MQVVITAAGYGRRFFEKGYLGPKAAVLVGGRPAITYLMDSFPKQWSQIFVLGEHDRASNLEKIIKAHSSGAKVIYSEYSPRGPIDTVLRAVPFLKSDEDVLVSYCDLAPIWNPQRFLEDVKNADMAVVTYQGFHPTYQGPNSYCHVRLDTETAEISELQEKKLFTDHIEKEVTSAGIYYFKNKDLLQTALKEQLLQGLKCGKEFYVSLAIQALINKNEKYLVREYRVDHVLQLGTPEDVERFEYWRQTFLKKEIIAENTDVEKNYWTRIFKSFGLI